MVGYTPSLSTAVWMGSDAREPIVNARGQIVYGAGLPGAIWQQFMNTVLEGSPEEDLPDSPAIRGDTGNGVPEPVVTQEPVQTQAPAPTTQTAPTTTPAAPTTQEPAPSSPSQPEVTGPVVSSPGGGGGGGAGGRTAGGQAPSGGNARGANQSPAPSSAGNT